MKKIAIAATLAIGSTLAAAQGTMSPAQYWQQHAQGGYMTPEAAVMYPAPAGRNASMIDANGDGRVSQSEWLRHHGESSVGDAAAPMSDGTDDRRNLADEERQRERGGTVPSTHLGNTGQ